MGWFADPVYLHGDYPQIMKNLLELKQKEEGDERCRLPNFSEEEKKIIKGNLKCRFTAHSQQRLYRTSKSRMISQY